MSPTTRGQGSAQGSSRLLQVRAWALWRRPRRMIVYLLGTELVALVGFVFIFMDAAQPTNTDWIRFAILAAGATVHIQLTQRQEERRRSHVTTVLIDLIAVWVFPAILLLPITLVVALLALIRVQRWFTARRPPHNFIYSSISHAFAAALAQVTYVAMGPNDWQTISLATSLREFGLVIVAALIYEGVQIIYVGGVLALGASSTPTVRNVLGSKADNLLEAITTGLGAITAVLLVTMPPAVAIMAVVTVVFNRLAELDQLQDDVRTDSKTGLLNMRGWTESAERAFERSAQAGRAAALLMIDFDHFKWINDTYGHPAGDDVLKSVGELLTHVTRPSDIVGRFGGEEFLVLLPQVAPETARDAAERIRSAVTTASIETTDKRGGKVTITNRTTSVGVAVYPEHGDTLNDLLHAADAAVYEAKEGGRDQVRFAHAKPVTREQPPLEARHP